MNKPTCIRHPLQQGDKVALRPAPRQRHHIDSHRADLPHRHRPGWRGGKVIVLHKAGYTEDLAEADLYNLG
ncbi:MAG: hypothetical protein U1F55_14695 [Chitinivorax sp.]